MKSRISYLIVLVTVMVIVSACTAATVQPTATTAPTQPPPVTETPRPSETPAPSNTSTLQPTASATLTPSVTPSATKSSTPTPSFAGFSVTYAQYTNYGMLIGFKIPGLKEDYRLMVNTVEYKCQINAKAVDSLYCYGPQFGQDQTVKLVFYLLNGDSTPLYETSYKVSLLIPPTVDPRILMTQAPGSCPARGVNITCETEYRNDGKGSYCIVATCNDACGYYYSMDTCPEGSIKNGIYNFNGTPPPLPPIHP